MSIQDKVAIIIAGISILLSIATIYENHRQ